MARETFAFQAPQPRNSTAPASGASRGASVQGGRSEGQAVTSTQVTDPGSSAGQLGAYFETLMAPYLERKKREQFVAGFNRAASGVALSELADGNSAVSQIFGPTGFEAGAQFYTAQERVARFAAEQHADMDSLKRLHPTEVARTLSERSQAMMTGDPFADRQIGEALVTQFQPLMATVATARYEHGQTEAIRTMSSAQEQGAALLQTTMRAQAALGNTPETTSAMRTAVTNYAQTFFVRPEGMSDASYATFLERSTLRNMRNGNGYAVEVARRSGMWDALPEEVRGRLETAYNRESEEALSDAMREHPEIMQSVANLNTDQIMERVSPADSIRRGQAINAAFRAATGFDHDYLDPEELLASSGNVVRSIHAGVLRQNARREALQDMNTRRGWELEDRAHEDQRELARGARLRAAFGTGAVQSLIASGSEAGDVEEVALNEYNANPAAAIPKLVAEFRGGWTSGRVRSTIQGSVQSAIGPAYTAEVGRVYQNWRAMNTANPGTAAAYYGEFHAPFQAFDSAMRAPGASPVAAYARAFDASRYATSSISEGDRAEATVAIATAMDTMTASRVLWVGPAYAGYDLNASGQRAVRGAFVNAVALGRNNSQLGADAIIREQMPVMLANGTIERYGAFAWNNGRPTTPIHQVMNVTPTQAGAAFMSLADSRLKAAGVSSGAYGNEYQVHRIPGANGGHVRIAAHDGERPVSVIISLVELRASARSITEREVRGNQPGRRRTADPHVGAYRY